MKSGLRLVTTTKNCLLGPRKNKTINNQNFIWIKIKWMNPLFILLCFKFIKLLFLQRVVSQEERTIMGYPCFIRLYGTRDFIQDKGFKLKKTLRINGLSILYTMLKDTWFYLRWWIFSRSSLIRPSNSLSTFANPIFHQITVVNCCLIYPITSIRYLAI